MFPKRRIFGLIAFLLALGLSVYQFVLDPRANWYWVIVAIVILVLVISTVYLMKQDIDHSITVMKPKKKKKDS